MKQRTKEEITRQIAGLKEMKKRIPMHSAFGDNNHLAIEVQLDILEGKSTLSDYDEFDSDTHWFDEDDLEFARTSAEEADHWMGDTKKEDLFDETWTKD